MAARNKWKGWCAFHSHPMALCGKSHHSSVVVAPSALFLDIWTETNLRKILQWAGGCLQRNLGMHRPWEKGLLWLLGNWLIPTKIKRSTQNTEKKKGKKKPNLYLWLMTDHSGPDSFFLSSFFCSFISVSLIAYTEQYVEYDPFITPAEPSNPWISDDAALWDIEMR